MALVDIIVRAKDGHDLTHTCVGSIMNGTEDVDYRIILVDDGSSPPLSFDANGEHVLVRHGIPRGAVSATNSGLAASFLNHDSEYVLILDNDTEIPEHDPGWLARMIAELEDRGPQAACVGATSTYVNRPQHILAVPQTYTASWEEGEKGGSKTQAPQVWFVSFAVLFHKEVLRRIGMWDEQYNPGNWEDTDYALQVRLRGYSVHVAQSVYIHHRGSQTFGPRLEELLATNKAKFVQKWGPGRLWDMGLISDREVTWMLEQRGKAS